MNTLLMRSIHFDALPVSVLHMYVPSMYYKSRAFAAHLAGRGIPNRAPCCWVKYLENPRQFFFEVNFALVNITYKHPVLSCTLRCVLQASGVPRAPQPSTKSSVSFNSSENHRSILPENFKIISIECAVANVTIANTLAEGVRANCPVTVNPLQTWK